MWTRGGVTGIGRPTPGLGFKLRRGRGRILAASLIPARALHRVVRAVLLVAAILLSGCSLPEAPESSAPGNGTPATSCTSVAEASASAPLLTTLQEDPEAIARRLAAALGGNVSGAPREDDRGAFAWREGDFVLTVEPAEGSMRARWERFREWRPGEDEARATLQRALDALQAPPGVEVVSTNPGGDVQLHASQAAYGQPLLHPYARLTSGAYAGVDVFDLREVRGGLELVDEDVAAADATRAVRCALDAQGLTEADGHAIEDARVVGLSAKGHSLTRVVHIRVAEPGAASHCGHVEEVHVDAVTAKVLTVARPPCD